MKTFKKKIILIVTISFIFFSVQALVFTLKELLKIIAEMFFIVTLGGV